MINGNTQEPNIFSKIYFYIRLYAIQQEKTTRVANCCQQDGYMYNSLANSASSLPT